MPRFTSNSGSHQGGLRIPRVRLGVTLTLVTLAIGASLAIAAPANSSAPESGGSFDILGLANGALAIVVAVAAVVVAILMIWKGLHAFAKGHIGGIISAIAGGFLVVLLISGTAYVLVTGTANTVKEKASSGAVAPGFDGAQSTLGAQQQTIR